MIDVTKLPGYAPGMAPIRLDDVGYMEELEKAWGRKWGAQSEMGKLTLACTGRPGTSEICEEAKTYPEYFFYKPEGGIPDLEKRRKQHANLVKAFEDNGVEMLIADFPDPAMGTYAPLRGLPAPEPIIINGGAIIPRCAYGCKRGNEVYWAKQLMTWGCPILLTIHGYGILELAPEWIDPDHALLPWGCRANAEGIRQLTWLLESVGVKEMHVVYTTGPWSSSTTQISLLGMGSGISHLDTAFTMVDRKLAIIAPSCVDYETLKYLERIGVNIIEIPPEEVVTMAGNSVTLEPGKVIMAAGNPVTAAACRGAGVEIIEVELSEATGRSAGGPDCLVRGLIREPGPYLDE
ncbi:dimethylarginine dimethylaminohydrolase family protein [Candidatus Omnitrophota bacterium]